MCALVQSTFIPGIRVSPGLMPYRPEQRAIDTVHSDQPIRALKLFRVVGDRLHSLHADYLFNAPIVRTEAPQSDGQRVAVEEDPLAALTEYGEIALIAMMRPGNQHGFYAWKLEHAQRSSSSSIVYMWDSYAAAYVDLFGKVVEHAYGYRAEAMRFVKIDLSDVPATAVAAMESLYQCEVVCHRSDESAESTSSSSPQLTVQQAMKRTWRTAWERLCTPTSPRLPWSRRKMSALWP